MRIEFRWLVMMGLAAHLYAGETDLVAKIENDDEDSAVATLAVATASRKGDLIQVHEAADALRSAAYELQALGKTKQAQRTAKAAIKLLEKASRKALKSSAGERAYLQCQIGDLYSSLMGDDKAALKAYREALREDPTNAIALEAVRLLKIESIKRGEAK